VRKLAATIGQFQMPAYYDQIDGTLTLAGATPAKPGPESGQPFTAAVKNFHSGKCIEIKDVWGAWNGGQPVTQWPCHGGDSQKFEFVPDGAGYFAIKAPRKGLCLQILNGSKDLSAALWTEPCREDENQKFKLIPDASGSAYKLMVKNDGFCITIIPPMTPDAVMLMQWVCGGDWTNFKWKLEM
jgi:hypothetical protein